MSKKSPGRPKHIPQRTCAICRQKMDKRRLTRIVRTPDKGVILDLSGKRSGRGAYVCDQQACWDKVLSNAKLLNQALMTTVTEIEMAAIAAGRPTGVGSQ
jgi:hypothetical protein